MIIFSVLPKAGRIGATVVIKGSVLDTGPAKSAGAGSVTFNGVKATPSKWDSNEIVVEVPEGATSGPLTIAVGGDAASEPFVVIEGAEPEHPIEVPEKPEPKDKAKASGAPTPAASQK